MSNSRNNRAQLNIRIPESHHAAAKLRAAAEGLTLGEYVDSLIMQAVTDMPADATSEIIADIDEQLTDLQAARAVWASQLADIALRPEDDKR